MRLGALAAAAGLPLAGDGDAPVTGFAIDHRKVAPGNTAIPPGEAISATLLLARYLWIGNLFENSSLPFLAERRKSDLVLLAEMHPVHSAALEQKTVDAVLRGLQSTLEKAAAGGEKVSVPGFFSLSTGHRAQREGRGQGQQGSLEFHGCLLGKV